LPWRPGLTAVGLRLRRRAAFFERLTDVLARRSSGRLGCLTYREPKAHHASLQAKTIDHSPVLCPGGRIGVYPAGPELRGRPAAPEPIASPGHFYTDMAIAELARRASLNDVEVRNHWVVNQ